jgi:threonine dehydrogenase-like Zn-dependent dehydrogenase
MALGWLKQLAHASLASRREVCNKLDELASAASPCSSLPYRFPFPQSASTDIKQTGLGGFVDGTLREYGAFDETGLVAMPVNLNWQEASTLPCAGLTAWNALYGLESRALKPGDVVLTQGTGGVSLFAIQVRKSRLICFTI